MEEIKVEDKTLVILNSKEELSKTKSGLMRNLDGICINLEPDEENKKDKE